MTDERIRKLVARARAGDTILPRQYSITVPMAHAIVKYACPEHKVPSWVADNDVFEHNLKQVEAACTRS